MPHSIPFSAWYAKSRSHQSCQKVNFYQLFPPSISEERFNTGQYAYVLWAFLSKLAPCLVRGRPLSTFTCWRLCVRVCVCVCGKMNEKCLYKTDQQHRRDRHLIKWKWEVTNKSQHRCQSPSKLPGSNKPIHYLKCFLVQDIKFTKWHIKYERRLKSSADCWS